VTDESHLAGYRPSPLGERRPGELLWTVRKDHVTWTCELKFHGESYGWEAMVFRETDFTISHRFVLREQAIRWAEAERQYRMKGGE
jgi:hypothetical protein